MLPATVEREKHIANAIKYYNEHNGTISYRKVASKFKVNHGTLRNRLNDDSKGPSARGGHNKILKAVEFDTVLLYIRNQALVGFPCTWFMILAAVSFIWQQNS